MGCSPPRVASPNLTRQLKPRAHIKHTTGEFGGLPLVARPGTRPPTALNFPSYNPRSERFSHLGPHHTVLWRSFPQLPLLFSPNKGSEVLLSRHSWWGMWALDFSLDWLLLHALVRVLSCVSYPGACSLKLQKVGASSSLSLGCEGLVAVNFMSVHAGKVNNCLAPRLSTPVWEPAHPDFLLLSGDRGGE